MSVRVAPVLSALSHGDHGNCDYYCISLKKIKFFIIIIINIIIHICTFQDAHNCIQELDSNTAMFAVYDGHGGE